MDLDCLIENCISSFKEPLVEGCFDCAFLHLCRVFVRGVLLGLVVFFDSSKSGYYFIFFRFVDKVV